MYALDKIISCKANSYVIEHMNDTLKEYEEYLNLLNGIKSEDKDIFLRTLKRMELKNNQEMEHENPFMLELELNSNNALIKSSIDFATNMVLKDENLTNKKLEQLHRLLISGTSDDKQINYNIRDFDTYVFEIINGMQKVSYIPPEPSEIKNYLKKLYSFMNENIYGNNIDIFYKSFVEHFFIAALQPFGNGNTRLARLLEYTEIYKLTREYLCDTLESPALYMSKNYLLTRKYYRDSISKIVAEPTDSNINKWFNYNLDMVDEQINFCSNALKKKYK